MKKYILGIAAFAALLAGCSKDDESTTVPSNGDVLYTEMGASMSSTRTTIGSENEVLWTLNDVVSVWSDEIATPQNFTLSEGAGTNTAKFKTTSSGVSGTTFYSVYPSSMLEATNTLTLPATQSYADVANFATNTNPMAAVGEDMMNMQFKHLCGIVVVELSADQSATATVNSIVLESPTPLAGKSTLSFESGSPVLTCTGSSQITLNCNVVLSQTPTSFYFVVPAAVYENGMDIKVNASIRGDGTLTLTKSRKSQFEVKAGTITRIGASFVLGTKSYAVGDLYEVNGVKGVVFETSNGGRSGKIIALQDASAAPTLWGPTSATGLAGVTEANDGSVNMEKVLAAGIDNYPAFKACYETGKIWYLPAINELLTINDQWPAIQETLETTVGATLMGTGNYWSSTVSGRGYSIYYLDSEGNRASMSLSSQSASSVRAIAQF